MFPGGKELQYNVHGANYTNKYVQGGQKGGREKKLETQKKVRRGVNHIVIEDIGHPGACHKTFRKKFQAVFEGRGQILFMLRISDILRGLRILLRPGHPSQEKNSNEEIREVKVFQGSDSGGLTFLKMDILNVGGTDFNWKSPLI